MGRGGERPSRRAAPRRPGSGRPRAGAPALTRGAGRALVLGAVAAGALGVFLIDIRQWADPFDEGYALLGAERILNGDVPYRDFWLVYAPAQFYVLAGLFKLFGFSMMMGRVFDALVRLAIVVLVFLISERLVSEDERREESHGPGPVSRMIAPVVSGVIATLSLGSITQFGYAMYPALALSLTALCVLTFHLGDRQVPGRKAGGRGPTGGAAHGGAERAGASLDRVDSGARSGWWTNGPLLCGLALGATALFRHDLGLYGALSIGAVVAASSWFGGGAADKGVRARAVLRSLWPFACGIALPVVPVALAFLATVPVRDLWFDLVVFPGTIMNRFRTLPLPPFPSPGMTWTEMRIPVLFYFPFLLFASSILFFVIRRRSWGIAAATLLGVFYLRQALNRPDLIHLLPVTLIVAILAPALLDTAARSWRVARSFLLIAAVAIIGGNAYIVGPIEGYLWSLRQPPHPFYTLPRGLGVQYLSYEEDAIRYVRDHTAAGEPIFVGNTRHDLIAVNDILFYFLAERPCATRYHDLTPGVVTTLPVQQEIVADLQKKKVRYLVVCSAWDYVREPNESGKSSGVTLLDDFIKAHYTPVAEFGPFKVAQISD